MHLNTFTLLLKLVAPCGPKCQCCFKDAGAHENKNTCAPTLKFGGAGGREFQKGCEVKYITWLSEGVDYLDRGVCLPCHPDTCAYLGPRLVLKLVSKHDASLTT